MVKFNDSLEDKETRDNILGYHPANTDTAKLHAAIREAAMATADKLFEIAPRCPERTLAFRHLQYFMMMTNAAIAINGGEPVSDSPSLPHAMGETNG